MPNWTDADGDWEAVLDGEGRFKSGYLVTPSPAYEARRSAQAAVAATAETAREATRQAKRDRLTNANSVAALRSYIEDELA